MYETLVHAIEFDDIEILTFVLNHGFEIDSFERFSIDTLLNYCNLPCHPYWSAYKSKRILFKTLVGGYKIEPKSELHDAVASLDEKKVQNLLEVGADVHVKDICDNTPLHLLFVNEASDQKCICNIARLLVAKGADIRARNHFGYTPFYYATVMGYISVVNFMLSYISGVEEIKLNNNNPWQNFWINDFDVNKMDELSTAIVLGYEQVVNNLIDRYDKNESRTIFIPLKKSPMYYALAMRKINVTKMLLEAGHEVDFR